MTGTVVDRELPTAEAADLLELTRDLVARELRPRADKAEAAGAFPRELFASWASWACCRCPTRRSSAAVGSRRRCICRCSRNWPRGWATIALGTSVHVLACSAVAEFGTREQQERFLPELLGGATLGAYCLSEAHAGSDAGAMRTRAVRDGDDYLITGEKAWITHGPVADFMLVAARTGDAGSRGISAFLVPATTPGISAGAPERKMGFRASPTTPVHFDGVRVAAERRIGAEGQGFRIAMAALDAGRLGISACAVGLAQAALDAAAEYAGQRVAFGRTIDEFQGVSFLLADAATQIAAARQLYLYAARRKDAGKKFSTEAAMAKLTATDMAMRVTTDMVQVLGGAGYVEDHPLERYMREAKVLQIVEGTNQIQRMVIARSLKPPSTHGSDHVT